MQGIFRARVPRRGVAHAFRMACIKPGGKRHRRDAAQQHGEKDELPPVCGSAGAKYPFLAHGSLPDGRTDFLLRCQPKFADLRYCKN